MLAITAADGVVLKYDRAAALEDSFQGHPRRGYLPFSTEAVGRRTSYSVGAKYVQLADREDGGLAAAGLPTRTSRAHQ